MTESLRWRLRRVVTTCETTTQALCACPEQEQQPRRETLHFELCSMGSAMISDDTSCTLHELFGRLSEHGSNTE
jgi:hypothetical protein